MSPRTEVIAHRGFSGRAPENTLAAFDAAIECGAERIEFDVLLTRDEVPVVIHDATLDRTTDGRGLVAGVTLEDLRRLDAGRWFAPAFTGERVPTLEEALDLCRGRIALNVEIKEEAVRGGPGPAPGGIEELVVRALDRHSMVDVTAVSSFEPLALRRLRELRPGLARETLRSRSERPGPEDLDEALREGSLALNVSREELWQWPELIAAAHERGLRVKVYTVDAPEEMSRLLELGADGIFTNRPDVLLALRDGR